MRIALHRALVLACLAGVPAAASAQLIPNLGGQRVGISAFQFLKLGVGARGVAMGESFAAVANDASALHFNPAGLVQFAQNEVVAAHTEYVAELRHEFFGVVYHFTGEDALGVAVTSLHTEDMEITTETQPAGTGRYFSFGDMALGVSYARKMTDQFSFGITLRYVDETLDVLHMRSFMVDLGSYYWTGLGSTRFAVVIANFGADASPSGSVPGPGETSIEEFQTFSLPTVFRLGIAIDPIDSEDHLLTASLQLDHPNDNAEHIRLGLEYSWRRTVFARLGIKRTVDQPIFGEDQTTAESYALGVGVRVPLSLSTIGADYAYSDFGRLGPVHRMTVAFTF
jgi:hypothetical protein